MKIFIKIFKVLFVSVVIVFLYSFSMVRNTHKPLGKVSVKITNDTHLFLPYKTVDKMLKQKIITANSTTKEVVFLKDLEKYFQANALVENAEVYRTIEGNLGLIIKQKTPIARVLNNNNVYYLDSNGSKMPLSKNYSASVPLISGISNKNDLKQAFKLASYIYNDAFYKKQIIGITKNSNNEFELQTRLGRAKILFGSLDNMPLKLNNLKAYYLQAIQNKSVNKYKKINLKYSNQVVCTK
jgi:cell division protein FtsQ